MSDIAALGAVARKAGAIAQQARQELERELKPDGSIVTNGDRTVERFLREELPKLVDAPIWGEEFGYAEESENGLWTVDPVDGTTNYAFGSPLWGVSIALVKGDAVEMGAVYLPDLDEMYLASRGNGSFCNGQKLPVIPPGKIERFETVSYNDNVLQRCPGEKLPGKMRCSGAFVVDGAFVAQQRYRGLIGVREKLYDMAACVCICRELGADVRYLDGESLSISALREDKAISKPWVIFPSENGFVLK